MTIEIFLILFCIGALTGILSGMFGMGGGIVIVPSLLALYSYTGFQSPYVMHIVIATSLFTIIFTSISASFRHFKKDNIIWKAALIIGICSSVTVFFFSKIAVMLPGSELKIIFSLVLLVTAVKMMFDKKKSAEVSENTGITYSTALCISIGVLSGAIAAFSGLGGGVFVVPLMHYLLKFPFKKAVGTSSAAILLTSASGVISYFINMPADLNPIPYSFGMVDVLYSIPIIVASILFAQLGAFIHHRIHSFWLSKLFAALILIISLKMLFF